MPVIQENNFIEMVSKMRGAQKDYFRLRDHNSLLEAKKYEGIVDRMLRDIEEKDADRQQGSLF